MSRMHSILKAGQRTLNRVQGKTDAVIVWEGVEIRCVHGVDEFGLSWNPAGGGALDQNNVTVVIALDAAGITIDSDKVTIDSTEITIDSGQVFPFEGMQVEFRGVMREVKAYQWLTQKKDSEGTIIDGLFRLDLGSVNV